ncbi:hypothetical protein JT359_19385 [Candidatus Poribacteria bacterium]|nr:hypothetical protein [Candidatus Poribacteria bacterium]
MKLNYHFKLLGFIITILFFSIPMYSFCDGNDQVIVDVDVDGDKKKYHIIETKQYKIVEVEDSPKSIEQLRSVAEQAIRDGEKDAVAHLNKVFWFSTGCFFPVIGPILSQRYQPFTPTARVLGKSPEYVAFYYDAYKVKTRKIQFNWALGGCLVGAPIGGYIISNLY